jgi:hypothetical protein
MSIMRNVYRELTDDEKAVVQQIKEEGEKLHQTISALSPSRELSIARTKIEEAVMWAVKHVTK